MTWLDVILYGPGWLTCALLLTDPLLERRFRRRYEQRWGQPHESKEQP